jgi:riboflavin synthase
MFTGIVEGTATVAATETTEEGRRLRLAADPGLELTPDALSRGQSIAVSGACLTVERFGRVTELDADLPAGPEAAWFEVFLATETVERTYLADLAVGDRVNVERALRADDRLDGHFVQGHVDATGEVLATRRVGEDWEFEFAVPEGQADYVVEKGSIAVDGISLTVASVDDGRFSVAIVPETYQVTTLSEKSVGDPVHLEVDVVAKYVESLVG